MTIELASSTPGMQRTRRNVMKMGAILAPAMFGTVHSAAAGNGNGNNGNGNGNKNGNNGNGNGNGKGNNGNGNGGGNGNKGNSNGNGNGNGGGGHAANCLLKGTKIRTARGERKIEDLAIGDLLPTEFSGLRAVQWIGHYSFRKSDPSKPWVKDALPVRIARSALAPDAPHADLVITASHSLLIDGALIPAEMLVNGQTITRYEPETDELEFFHLKLESHDVVYAEGAPAETLANVDESFVNFADYLRRYGTPAADDGRCAPRVHIGGRAELMSRLRSALSPWLDLRDQADIVRDRLEERAIASPFVHAD